MKTFHPDPPEAIYYWEKKVRPNIWTKIPENLSSRRTPACQTLSKALDISNVTAQVAPDLLKALAILSDMTVRRSAVDREDLKSEKRPHFSRWSTILLFTSFPKSLLPTEGRLTGQLLLAVDLSPTFSNAETTNAGFNLKGDDLWFMRFWVFRTEFFVILSLFTTRWKN